MMRTAFAGASTVLISDEKTSILVDGYFSRVSRARLIAGRVRPDLRRIDEGLGRLGVHKLAAVLVSHSHVDHVLDAPIIAHRRHALLAGSASTRMIQEGYGLGHLPFAELVPGRPLDLGSFRVTPIRGAHGPGDRAPGEITRPITLPARAGEFKTGGTYSFHIDHPFGSVLVHGSAHFVPGALDGLRAEAVYLGVGAAGKQTDEWRTAYWTHTVGAVGARRVRPVHWDAFWRPLERGLRPLPRALDRLDQSMSTFRRRADAEGVDLRIPIPFVAEHFA